MSVGFLDTSTVAATSHPISLRHSSTLHTSWRADTDSEPLEANGYPFTCVWGGQTNNKSTGNYLYHGGAGKYFLSLRQFD